MENTTTIEEEILVISSVCPEEFECLSETGILQRNEYQIKIFVQHPGIEKDPLILKWVFGYNYPSNPPVFSLHASWLHKEEISLLCKQLNEIHKENLSVIIFIWVDWYQTSELFLNARLRDHCVDFLGIGERLQQKETPKESKPEIHTIQHEEELQNNNNYVHINIPTIYQGEAVNDRKSKFIAHCAVVHSVEDVELVLNHLKEDKKIREATHNISAYRIISQRDGKDIVIENRDDDGETGAGEKILYMLQRIGAKNVMVVVTRWFGGILLGTNRFKIITNVAKDTLMKFLKDNLTELENKTSKKKDKDKKPK